MFSSDRFVFELIPPLEIDQLAKYMQQVEQLFVYSKTLGITSHPSPTSNCDGFDRSLNLARYIRNSYSNDMNIVMNLTCRNLNKHNIAQRLFKVMQLDIKDLLIVTGDDYISNSEDTTGSHFSSSLELLEYISTIDLKHQFRNICVGGYPNCENLEMHLENLASKLKVGANTVVTQCVNDAKTFVNFRNKCNGQLSNKVHIVPSLAIVDDLKSVKKFSKLARLELDEQLVARLAEAESLDDQKHLALKHVAGLFTALNSETFSKTAINVCCLNKFDATKKALAEAFKK